LTYGDDCANRRAIALRRVVAGDVLLFWSMLWENTGNAWADFTGVKGWFFVGALRVSEVLSGGQRPGDASPEDRARAEQNVHFSRGVLPTQHRVFIGDQRYSALFNSAIDLGVYDPNGLVYRTMHAADKRAFMLNGRPRWSSSLRPCRAMWDLGIRQERNQAQIVRDEILRDNDYDLLQGL